MFGHNHNFMQPRKLLTLKKNTHDFIQKSLKKRFEEGVTNDQKCLKEFFELKNCTWKCHLISYMQSLPPCETIEEYSCMVDSWYSPTFTNCFKYKLATTYSLSRTEYPFHKTINDSITTFDIELRSGAKEIQQEVLLLTLQDWIGSVGGSLGCFSGFPFQLLYSTALTKPSNFTGNRIVLFI